MRAVQREREAERAVPLVWVAADYHFPSTYSCRIPMSSMSSAPVMPTPGPATVRLALIKAGIECYGLDTVRNELYPIVRQAAVRVRPPERVAISQQLLRGYKWSEDRKTKRGVVQESIMVREMAHAGGPMTVYLQMPQGCERRLGVVLRAVGYWGQSSSLAFCLGVMEAPPVPGECAQPLTRLNGAIPLRPYFSCLAAELRADRLSWEDLVADSDAHRPEVLRLEVYVWPMVTEYHQGAQKLLVRVPLTGRGDEAL